jgi:hypothetical protein
MWSEIKWLANAGTFLLWLFFTPAAVTLALFAMSWLLAPTRRHLRRRTIELAARHLLLPTIGMLVVTVGLMRLTDGWWPVIIAVVGSSAGELVYQTALPRLVYDLERPVADIETRSDANRKRVIESWQRSTGRGSGVPAVEVVLAAAMSVIWLPCMPLRALYPLWAPHFFLYGGHEGGGGG